MSNDAQEMTPKLKSLNGSPVKCHCILARLNTSWVIIMIIMRCLQITHRGVQWHVNPDPWQIRPVSGGSTRTNSKSTETVDQKQHEFSAAALHSQGAKALKPAGLSGRPFHHVAAMAIFPKASHAGTIRPSKLSAQPFHHVAVWPEFPTKASIAGTIRSLFQPSHSIMRRLWPDPKSILLAPFDKAFIPSWLWPCSQKHLYCWHHSLKLSARPFHHVAAMAIPKSSYCWHQSFRAFFCLYRSTSSARNLIIESQFSRWA